MGRPEGLVEDTYWLDYAFTATVLKKTDLARSPRLAKENNENYFFRPCDGDEFVIHPSD